MSRERFRRAKEVFHAAIELPDGEREAWVREACAGDAVLLEEVRSLLTAAAGGSGHLEAVPIAVLARAAEEKPPAADGAPVPPRRIGSWTILREVGRGGMGSVYLAERSDRQYKGHAALKLVKRGMDTEFILNRFRAERQILASLSHPNIARLLDGGTTDDGRPYFVMEFIDGQILTDYCASHGLGLRERIDLFRTVCAAVQFAHRSLVVHRDIKPSNLMVTADGTVKLLDFGLAKLLDPQQSGQSFYQTVAGVGIFTPEYASPEQVRSLPVTTSTDVFSLGVVLYELLSLTHPFRHEDSTPADILKALLEQEPPPPSAAATDPHLSRALKGDLDTIVLTALRKEPERRYATVEKLSADLGRYLSGLPVSARPDTLVYRTGKFVRRHKVGVAASVLVALSLVAGLSGALWEARAARRNESLARKRFGDVRKLARTVLFDLHDGIKPLPGSTPVREQLVRTALEYLNGLSVEAEGDPDLMRELAEAYARVGDVQGGVGQGNLGDTRGALASYRKALALREALAERPDVRAADRQALAEALERMSDALSRTGDSAGALSTARRAVKLSEKLQAAAPSDPAGKGNLALALQVLGEILAETGDGPGALECYRKETRLYQELLLANPGSPVAKGKVLVGHHQIGEALMAGGDAPGAVSELRTAVRMGDELIRKEPGNADFQRYAAFAQKTYGLALTQSGAVAPGLAAFGRSREIFEDILKADPRNANVRMFLASLYSIYGRALVAAGRRADGVALQRKGLVLLAKVASEDPRNEVARQEKEKAETRLAESGIAPGG